MNQTPKSFLPPHSVAKYNNSRAALLALLILSAINVFALYVGYYFLFSAYLPLLFTSVGYEMFAQSGEIIYYVVSAVIAIIFLVPYLLCFIFSKKHYGWMIGALVLYGIDTVLFLFSTFIPTITQGDMSFLVHLLFCIYVLVSLILSIKYGKEAKRDSLNADLAAKAEADRKILEGETEESTEAAEFLPARTLVIRRKKAFTAAFAPLNIYVNGNPAVMLKNGQMATVTVPGETFVLSMVLGKFGQSGCSTKEFTIPQTDIDYLDYTVSFKMGWAEAQILLNPTRPTL